RVRCACTGLVTTRHVARKKRRPDGRSTVCPEDTTRFREEFRRNLRDFFMPTDRDYMDRALALAALARGRTSPNPMVGCVVVRDGDIIGEGYHMQAGGPHAEVMALRECGDVSNA